MRIIVDGDACPSVDKITVLAEYYNIEMIIFCDFAHMIKSEYAKVITVDQGFQMVDMAIVKEVINDDLVITQDYGLALMCLEKAIVINPKGFLYTKDNIDILLGERFINMKTRKLNKRVKGPKKRTSDDEKSLLNLIERIIRGESC